MSRVSLFMLSTPFHAVYAVHTVFAFSRLFVWNRSPPYEYAVSRRLTPFRAFYLLFNAFYAV